MSPRFVRSLFTAGCLTLTACSGAANTGDSAQQDALSDKASMPAPATQQEVETAAQDFVTQLRAGNAAAANQYYTTDAVFISARGKVEGRDAIAAFWTSAVKDGAGKSLQLEPVKWGASGDMAYSLSRYTGGITAPSGYVIAVSQRQPDGTLQTVAQISIPDAPAKR